ncbi:MAG: hypothetical protein A2070_02605 [Bdellovibrionales bacterium GWC1_52_8]|nr:MAG: hypothetical protein A2Z97_03785 [Bdellovibrionales bacterium GWB1_52_6]OFZ03751.1 MAG: hypothetical protein A2X97_14455 [Bdellovibrionales bacterium GWA1_52_35]OFZ43095.1 MAG: hypothetical protein A2070_02605 [Bdellovibrionales bacterium GWC1_52_8]
MKSSAKNPVARKSRKIVWALDAFERAGALQRNAIRTLQLMSKSFSLEILPVFILQEQLAGPSLEFSPVWIGHYRSAAEQGLRRILQNVKIPGLLPPRILPHTSTSTTAGATSLIQFALKQKAELILTNTHSKSGLKRMFLGSFAESLLLRSPIPVLTVGPHYRSVPDFRRILFPTEFGTESFQVFKRLVAEAAQLKSEVILLHVIPYPVRPYLSANVIFPSSYWNMLQDYLRNERERTESTSQTWSEFAKRYGVKITTIVDEQPGSLWEAVLRAADENKVGLIAMEAESGPVSATLAGSAVRQTVRHAPCPVWIIGSRYAQAHLKAFAGGGRKAA